MTAEPKRIQVVRSHQDISEFAYNRDRTREPYSQKQLLLLQQDYSTLGWKRLNKLQSLPLKDNWPITLGNAAASFSSGFLAGLITRRMAANLTLNLTSSTLPSSGASFFVATLTHLAAYYYSVLRPLYSDDPMLCPTCLEIRAFTIGSFTPLIMGTTTAVLANLSTVILNKTLRLPEFHIRAYRDWQYFFQKHAFKGMAQRHYFIYPLMNGFLASMILLGQSYYWKNGLRQHLDSLEQQSLPSGKLNK